jgi:hypothetical protein
MAADLYHTMMLGLQQIFQHLLQLLPPLLPGRFDL